MIPRDPSPRILLLTGLWLLACALALLIVMTGTAHAGQFTPPTRAQGQRIFAKAVDARLRSIYPRSGIRTRCRGNGRYLLCSVHVWRRSTELFWTITEVRVVNGRVRTSLSSALDGCVAIPGKTLSYRSTPTETT